MARELTRQSLFKRCSGTPLTNHHGALVVGEARTGIDADYAFCTDMLKSAAGLLEAIDVFQKFVAVWH